MADVARPVRASNRMLKALQSKENPVHKTTILTKQSTTVRATLGEISNRAPSLVNQADKAGLLKKQSIAPAGKSTLYSKSTAALKENIPVEKPKGLAVKQSNVIITKPVARPSITAKPLVANKAGVSVLKRTTITNSKPKGLKVQDVNKPKTSILPSGTLKSLLIPGNTAAPKPKLVVVKETVLEVKEVETVKQIEIKPEVKIQPAIPEPIGFSTEQINKLEEVDTRDQLDPQQVVDYVRDIYEYMKELEILFSVPRDYIKQSKHMNYNMRAVLMDWLVDVHRQFKLMPETLYLAVAIFDRYMPLAPNTKKQQLQLVGIVSMLIAAKYEEIMCPTIGDCTYITDNTYSKKEVMEMEMKVLGTLSFNVGKPLPLHFLRRYTKCANVDYVDHGMAKYFLELALVRHEMCHVAPSLQAAAALCLAMWYALDLLRPNVTAAEMLTLLFRVNNCEPGQPLEEMWSISLQYFSGYTYNQIEETIKLLVIVVIKAHKSKLVAVRKKYAMKTNMEISNIVEGALSKINTLFS